MRKDTEIARRDSDLKIRLILFVKSVIENTKDDNFDSIDALIINTGLGPTLNVSTNLADDITLPGSGALIKTSIFDEGGIIQVLPNATSASGNVTANFYVSQSGSITLGGGTLLDNRDYRDPESGVERAIECYGKALLVRTHSALPQDWADTRNNMGNAYMARTLGDRRSNVEQAIQNYLAALEERTRRRDPIGFVATEKALAAAYSKRLAGDPKDNQGLAASAYAAAMNAVDDLIGKWA